MTHPAIASGHVAVVTGAASGIGLAAARRFVQLGLKVCLVDRQEAALARARDALGQRAAGGADSVMAAALDVGDRVAMDALARTVGERWGAVHVLMNNAGIQPPTSVFGSEADWAEILRVNLGGVVAGCQAFVPAMLAAGGAGLVINTGSKQGITTPPGNPAYNVSKAGVKVYTEALQHDLRNRESCRITAHLLIPGFVFTPLTANGRTEQPAGAWTPDQTVDFLFERLEAGDFYILCPDGEVTREMDEMRIAWAAGDIVENRPPLSRWHPDHADAFKDFAGR
ncbi:SDR family NAD(P)-dependent oxidoreductase [Mangrovibrevibacter kandeliae]|uniref:SDR family NAD(P)-dependent oxidoreductase n=1 Tax=Mangrovibrevibacter kandeliae TaxID=2968473 RepID=UPI0021195D8D|nr:SDR family NAD(P)-dependent oxidoreductase [Aurantimonas sp. CSK15Z-1]MCQ8784343.1 SDR family NAD(P)-dependent oxidoreductase [Aurantimonas sp. CSK15Z-1]